MEDNLRPYPEYKQSGLQWLDQTPAHWEVRRNGRLFSQRNETGFPNLPILEVSLKTGVRVRDLDSKERKQIIPDRSKYKRAAQGYIAYNMMRLWQGAVGVAPIDGLVSPAYVVAKPHDEVDSRYYAYLFRTAGYMEEVNKYSRGIVSDRNRLYWDEFKQMPSLYPPPEEQTAIAGYLDGHAVLVGRFIRNKRRLIDLLNEQKQATIERAVTRGLSPHVPLKPSGVDWLGNIPENWDVRSLKQIASVRLSGVDKHVYEGECRIRLCNYTDVYYNDLITPDMQFMDATATSAEIASLALQKNDVLITKDSETWNDIAVPALVEQDLDRVLCGYHLALLRPDPEQLVGEYLCRALRASLLLWQFNVAASGVTRYGLSQHAIKSAVFPLPPTDEQEIICATLCKTISFADAAIERARREIELIREYRTRLIDDVVAGKLDIRHLPVPVRHLSDLDALSEAEGDGPESDDLEADEEVAVGG